VLTRSGQDGCEEQQRRNECCTHENGSFHRKSNANHSPFKPFASRRTGRVGGLTDGSAPPYVPDAFRGAVTPPHGRSCRPWGSRRPAGESTRSKADPRSPGPFLARFPSARPSVIPGISFTRRSENAHMSELATALASLRRPPG